MSNAWKKLRWSFKQRGIVGTFRSLLQRGLAGGGESERVHPFDATYGTDTGGVIGGGALGAGHAHDAYITAYAAMPPSRFEATMERWLAQPPSSPIEAQTFVDIGCGKGRVVFLASRRPFARVIGVELDPGLSRIAQANLLLWKQTTQPATAIEFVCADATELPLPPGPCLLYLANSFAAPVLRRLLEELEKRAQTDAGAVDLIYQNPEHRAVFTEFPAWRPLWDEAFPLSPDDAESEPVYRADDRCLAWRLENR